ncbi:endo-1,4-beta-xylanase [Alkalicoccus halolimnae]|uniref:Beta-xylanase n=1 Tax=Alkalicoccus halolimnae TaxID=1667239 RepID=A0AAJ8N2I3_9BACI|nr:endo-1,4-beta-xylanase [Alkalicoccus halolimnae]
MKQVKRTVAAALAVTLAAPLAGTAAVSAEEHQPHALDVDSMEKQFEDSFDIGAAVELYQLEGEHGEILKHHYSSVVAENVMKPLYIQPEEGEFNWEEADQLVEFANEHDLELRYHTLIWHNQVPEWFFLDEEGNEMVEEEDPEQQEANKELLLERLETHVKTVVERYKDDVDAWDVVNEVIDDGGGMRETEWYQITGDEYIKTAFHTAREYGGEDAKLFINDYNTEINPKRDDLYDLVKEMLDEGVPIDGIGHQAHIQLDWPTIGEIEESILLFDELGLETHITELDVSLYGYPPEPAFETYEDIPEEAFERQAERYHQLFSLYKSLDDAITSLTFWGIADDHTWLDDRAEEFNDGVGKDAPFVFDVDKKVKPAYWAVMSDETPSEEEMEEGVEPVQPEEKEGDELPETASNSPLYALIGLLMAAGAAFLLKTPRKTRTTE